MLNGSVLITGGTGTLGKAIVRRAAKENWPCTFTIYSRDEVKQQQMKHDFPDLRYSIGDVADYGTLEKVVVGHDLIIHAAAFKHIPAGELNVRSMRRTNVEGSENVGNAALAHGIKRVVGISTDKVCHPVNAYGCSKMMMERDFQELNRVGTTKFHLTRYGNVLGSTGSVVPVWKKMLEQDGYVTSTDPDMTRFWLTVEQAVDLILLSLSEPAGTITVLKHPSLKMNLFAQYVLPGVEFRYPGLRPGEKRHEELLTAEESPFVEEFDSYFRLWPVWGEVKGSFSGGYSSQNPVRSLTRAELLEMLEC